MAVVIDRMFSAYRREFEKNPVLTLFLTILIVFFIIFVVAAIITSGDSARLILIYDGRDTFMDYFNSIMYSSDNPYTDWGVMYPPLVTTLYAVLGHFIIPFAVAEDNVLLSFTLRYTQMGIMSFLIITILTLFILRWIFERATKNTGLCTGLLFFMIVFSFPFIFALERGNSILLTLVFCFIFLLGYRSENNVIRYVSYIALGFAAGFKIYPAILLLLIIRERRYKEATICATIVAVLLLVPFVFTDGTPMIYLDTLFTHSGTFVGVTNINQITTGFLHLFLGIPATVASIVSYVILGLFTLLSVIVILFDKEMKFWKIIALISCNLILGFGIGYQYQMVYMAMPILYFLAAEREMTRENKFYVICFAMTMALIPGFFVAGFHPSWVVGAIETPFVIIIAIALLREGIGRIRRNRRGAVEQTSDASA